MSNFEYDIPAAYITKSMSLLRDRLRVLLPVMPTDQVDWAPDWGDVPERFRGELFSYIRSYVMTRLTSQADYDPLILNMDTLWKAIVTGSMSLINTDPDYLLTNHMGRPQYGTGAWSRASIGYVAKMSVIVLPDAGLTILQTTLDDLDALLG